MLRLRNVSLLVLATTLGACSYGQRLDTQQPFFDTMHDGIGPFGRSAAMTAVSPDWALTNDHADGIADNLAYEAAQADLALVRIPDHAGQPLPFGVAAMGDSVHMYGSGATGDQRVAHGTVIETNAFVCWGKPNPQDADNQCKQAGFGVDRAIVLSATAGDGFSGGPVTNDKGELIGITSREFYTSGGFVGPAGTNEGQLLAKTVPVAYPDEHLFLVYPIKIGLEEFFPNGDPSQQVSATAKPAKPASWFERWGWVVLVVLL